MRHLKQTTKMDIRLLFATRMVRLFAYGFLSVILALYLTQIGLTKQKIGLLLTLTLAGDIFISLGITTSADRIGRRKMLLAGAGLMAFSGIVFIMTRNFMLLIVAAIIGVISPSGNEIGPFLSIEQAALSQLVADSKRTSFFGWYNLAGSFSTASGALFSGLLSVHLQGIGVTPLGSYQAALAGYIACGFILAALFLCLSPMIETQKAPAAAGRLFGLHQSKSVVLKLSTLFALDAFAGGLIIQSILVFWFFLKFGADESLLGIIFFWANILAGMSALLASRIAEKFGLINTMVFTHIPSNILLCLVPLMPTLPLSIAVLLLRFSISQMDVPTRQSYTMMVAAPDERSAASGVTTIARSIGASISPAISGLFLATPVLMNLPFFLAGGLKIIYDLLLYYSFKKEDRSSAFSSNFLRKNG